MPLSEFYTMAKGKVESTQHKTTTCSNDLSYGPDNEFVELVWENGQLMMQGQSSRVRKSPIFNTSPSQTPKLREREIGSSTNSKMVKFGAMGSVSDDFPIPVASGEMGLGQDDELVPWLNYPIDDTLENDYCSELLPELSGVTANELTVQNSFTSIDKKNSCNQTIKGSHNVSINGVGLEQGNGSKVSSSGGDELSKSRSTQLYPWSSQHGETSVPSIHSGVSGISSNNTRNTHHVVCGSSSQGQASETGFPIMKMQKKDSGLPNASSGFLNFSQYLRPAGLVTANLQNLGPISTPGSSGTESYMVPAKLDSQPLVAKPLDESRPAGQSDAVCEENAVKDNESMDQAPDGSPTKEMEDVEKTVEPIVASSSVCSGNSAERASNGRARNLKRKFHEADDSEYRSEDIEEESVGVRKAAPARGGTSSKRSRAAEVHNLSERRRRDRINEKMRALQELIPNCNKVDKASMLDEAIEYLKTLQLQVQIMSMGAGLYMPPMMLPAGMQHIHAGHMGHFSPMGVGMGMRMGMGYDMGMIQVPPMHGAHFSAPHISGSNSFHGMAGSNLPVFGLPGQGLPMSMPRPPLGPYSGGPPMTSAVGPNTSSSLAVPAKVPISASMSSSKDLIENANSHMVHDANANNSMNQTSSQCHARNKGFEQSPLVSKHDQSQNISCNEAVHLANASEIAPNTLVDQPVVSDIQD